MPDEYAKYKPGLLPDPENDGVIIVSWKYAYRLTMKNGQYTYTKMNYSLNPVKNSFASVLLPADEWC